MVAKGTLTPCSGKISCFRGRQCTMAHRGQGFRNTGIFTALSMLELVSLTNRTVEDHVRALRGACTAAAARITGPSSWFWRWSG